MVHLSIIIVGCHLDGITPDTHALQVILALPRVLTLGIRGVAWSRLILVGKQPR